MNNFCNEVIKFSIKGIFMIGNPFTGALIGLTKKGEEFVDYLITCETEIDERALDSENYNLYQAFKERGVLKNYPASEAKSRSAYVHVNDKCNLHCKGCYSYISDRNLKKELTTEQLFLIFQQLTEEGFLKIVISGGEPLLRNDLPEICEQAKSFGVKRLSVISNGTMPYDTYDRLIPNIDSLAISVDGYNQDISFIRDPGIMHSVFRIIKYVKDKIPTSLIVTLHKKNVDAMRKYVDLANELGVTMSFSILSVDPNELDLSEFLFDESDFVEIGKTLMALPKEMSIMDTTTTNSGPHCWVGCEFGKQIISVGSNGNIYPCHMLMNETCIMGNVLKKTLGEILKTPVFDSSSVNAINVGECRECQFRFVCGGGCPARSFLKYRDFSHTDPYCTATRTYYNLLFDSLAQLPR